MTRTATPARRDSPNRIDVGQLIESSAARIAAALPEHFTPAKMVQVLSILTYRTPKLALCVPESIITSIITAGSLGFDLTPSLGEAYLIPRWNKQVNALECQLQPGYHGLKKLAMQTGQIASIDPRLVRAGEKFKVIYDPDLNIYHEPHFDDMKAITHIYCVTKLTNGERKIEVMTTDQIEAIRARSDSADKGPWVTDWAEMGKKTVFKRQSKYLPRSLKLAEAIALDDRQYEDKPAVLEHHAVNHNNDTGHGSGAYASPEEVENYRQWLVGFINDVNAKWLDRWTAHDGIKAGVRELLSTYQMSGHLCKWAWAEQRINAPEKPKARQIDQFVAILFHRDDRLALIAEAEDYGRRKWREAAQALKAGNPHEFPADPEDEVQDAPAVEDASQEDDALDAALDTLAKVDREHNGEADQ